MTTSADLRAVVQGVRFTAPSRYRLGGQDRELPSAVTRLSAGGQAWQDAAAATVARDLYETYYLRRPAGGLAPREPRGRITTIRAMEEPGFGALLRRANAGSGFLLHGWTVTSAAGLDRWRITDGAVSLLAERNELDPPPDGTASVGSRVAVRFPKDMPYASAGFYLAVSDAGPPGEGTPAVRIYVNVPASAACDVLRRLTGYLSASSLRASIKVVNHPDRYDRPDACVVFMEKAQFLAVSREVASVLRACTRRSARPAFTKAWLPGVGIAEEPAEPGPTTSFGEHRCRAVGAGLVRADLRTGCDGHRASPSERASRLGVVREHLLADGLDPDRLYLNPGSEDVYPDGR